MVLEQLDTVEIRAPNSMFFRAKRAEKAYTSGKTFINFFGHRTLTVRTLQLPLWGNILNHMYQNFSIYVDIFIRLNENIWQIQGTLKVEKQFL